MPSWEKRLAAMVADPDPRSYTYDEVARILERLAFVVQKGGGSHRKFRREIADANSPSGRRGIIVGLVQKGHGTLPPKYITEMIRTLRANHLLPDGVE